MQQAKAAGFVPTTSNGVVLINSLSWNGLDATENFEHGREM